MITSKLTSKSQTTIPQPVRKALGLAPGDELGYAIEDGRAVLVRVETDAAVVDPYESFSEWQDPEDEAAYARL